MKQAVKATVLILFVSLLSGCSSSEEKACKAAKEQHIQYDLQYEEAKAKYALFSKAGNYQRSKAWLGQSNQSQYNKQLLVISYQNCFTPKELVEAKRFVGVE
jgi:hypothetical protein